jgi:succinyl-diaminopimelate desuccinylase
VLNNMPPVETPSTAPLILAAVDAMTSIRGDAPAIRGMSYYTDASILAAGLDAPALICGPGDERLAHQANERVRLDGVLDAARFYFQLIQRRLAN